jgi:tRNA(Ile)-lysidine synthase
MSPGELAAHVLARVPPGQATVALSGGADSSLLAWALSRRPGVIALTIDHGLPHSAAMARAASAVASAVGLDHSIVAVAPRSSSETDLRSVRLSALEANASGWIVTGHTADDVAETVMGNLLRGAGASGMAAIPERRDRYIRPMLDLTRIEVRRAAHDLGLPFADDPMNDDPAIRRNRLRIETIPGLAKDYNPELVESLRRTARLAAQDEAVLARRAETVPIRTDEEAVLIPAAALTTLPTAVAARVVRRALRIAAGPGPGDEKTVIAILDVAAGAPPASLCGGLSAIREGPWGALAGPPPETPAPQRLPGRGSVRFGPWLIEVGRGRPVPAGDLVVRAARPGDRIAFEGGSKRVVDVFRESCVPVRLRPRWPVVESGGRIAWVVGLRAVPLPPGGSSTSVAATREAE